MVNLIRKLFAKGIKQKVNFATECLEASENYACIRSMKENFRQCMYDPIYKDYRGKYSHPQSFIERNEEILKNLLQQYALDSKFIDNLDELLQGDIEELTRLSKTSTEYQFEDPEEPKKKVLDAKSAESTTFSTIRDQKVPPSEVLFNRPWLVKMRTNEDGFSTFECYAIDDDGEIVQVNGHPVPPLPSDAPKHEWKSLNESLKLREIPPMPKCPKHKHLQEPPQFELVRETILQATIHSRHVNNGQTSILNVETNEEEEETELEEDLLGSISLPNSRHLTIRSREMQERMIRNAYFRMIGHRTRKKNKRTALSVTYAQKNGSSQKKI